MTPRRRMTASLLSVSVPGSHSNVISSALFHAATAPRRFTRPLELLRREKRRRAAAEVDEVQRPAGDRRQLAVQLELARQHVEILVDLARVLVGVDPEVAEVAPLAAERNVQVHAERHVGRRRRRERRHRVGGDGVVRPDGERRIGGDEVAADLGRLGDGRACRFAHGRSLNYIKSGPRIARLAEPAVRALGRCPFPTGLDLRQRSRVGGRDRQLSSGAGPSVISLRI